MANGKGVSSKTHSRAQLNDYANQHNPNNKAYHARIQNNANQKENSRNRAKQKYDIGILDGESYGWCDE